MNFFKWHAGTVDALTGINEKRPDWQLLLDSKEKFDLVMSDAKVPRKELSIIWEALQSTSDKLDTERGGSTLRQRMSVALMEVPTLRRIHCSIA